MPRRLRNFFLGLLAGLFCIPAVSIYSELSRRSDIWWTPAPLAPTLADSQDRVEIYARGQPLGRLVQARLVSIVEGGESQVLSPGEIRVRFNNWDRVRAKRVPLLLASAAACGAIALLFGLVAAGRLVYRGEDEAARR
jgi:hypothetical protein